MKTLNITLFEFFKLIFTILLDTFISVLLGSIIFLFVPYDSFTVFLWMLLSAFFVRVVKKYGFSSRYISFLDNREIDERNKGIYSDFKKEP